MQSTKLDTGILEDMRAEFGIETLVELLCLASTSAENELCELVRQIEAGADGKVRRIAHSLVGILGQYGAANAARCARETQTAEDEVLVAQARELVAEGQAALIELKQLSETLAKTGRLLPSRAEGPESHPALPTTKVA